MDGSSLFTMESCFRIHHLTFVSSNCDSLRSYNMTCFLISISIYLLRDWNRLLFANLIIETFRLCAVEPQLLTRWSYITTVGFLCQQSKLRFKRALCQWSTVSLDTHSEVHTHTQTHQTSCHCLSPCWICPVKAHVDVLCSPNSKHLPSAHWLQPRTWV